MLLGGREAGDVVRKLSLDFYDLPPGAEYYIHRISASAVNEMAHTHAFYQICYVERGQVQHWSGDECVSSYYGDAFIVPPEFVHRIVFPSEGTLLYALSFSESLLRGDALHPNAARFLTALRLDTAQSERIGVRMKVTLDESRRQTMRELLELLIRQSDLGDPPELSAAESLISAILCVLSQSYFSDSGRMGKLELIRNYNRSMRECIEYIDRNFALPLTLRSLTTRFALSRSTFGLLFPRFAGMPFKQYLTKKRIEHAALLVQTTELPLQEIARMAGYEEFSTFYRCFRRVVGVSPSRYRAGDRT